MMRTEQIIDKLAAGPWQNTDCAADLFWPEGIRAELERDAYLGSCRCVGGRLTWPPRAVAACCQPE